MLYLLNKEKVKKKNICENLMSEVMRHMNFRRSDLTNPPCRFNEYDNNTNGDNSDGNYNDNNNNDSNDNTDNKNKNINNGNMHFYSS